MTALLNGSARILNHSAFPGAVCFLRICSRLDSRLVALLVAVTASATTVGLTG